MKKTFATIAIAALLTGCAGVPEPMSPAEAARMEQQRFEAIKNELGAPRGNVNRPPR